MGRAAGRKNFTRVPLPDEPNPERDYIGESARQDPVPERAPASPIGAQGGSPGGPHLINHPTVRQHVPVPAPKPEHRGIMEHGVPTGKGEINTREHAVHERGGHENASDTTGVHQMRPKYAEQEQRPAPVPVYVVDTPGQGGRPLHTLAGDKFTVPAKTSDPIRVAGRDLDRTEILFLVETAQGAGGAAPQGVRIDHEVGNLTVGGGFLIPAGTTSYQRFHCNDELFAVSTDASACTLSVVYLYGVAGAG